MPEPEPGERFPRSVFLEGATLGLGAVIGGIVTVPAIGFAVLPAFLKQHSHEVDLVAVLLQERRQDGEPDRGNGDDAADDRAQAQRRALEEDAAREALARL